MRWAALVLASALAWPAAGSSGKVLLEGYVMAPGGRASGQSAREFAAAVRPRDVFSLANLITEPEIYQDFVERVGDPDPGVPVIDSIEAYPGGGPPGIVVDGTMARIIGRNLISTVRVMVGSRACLPLVTGPGLVIARLSGAGPAAIRLVNNRGIAGPPLRILLVRITGELAPPGLLRPGESRGGLVRVEGTAAPIGIRLAADSASVSFAGRHELEVRTTGGARNVASFAIRAEKPGAFRIRCNLAYNLSHEQ